jgi:hypothetical protein
MKTFRPPVKDIEMTTPVSSSFVTVQQHERTKTQLPENWAKDKDVDGNKYYYNKHSGETSWVAPNGSKQVPVQEGHGRTKTQLPENWAKDKDVDGNKYYYHKNSGETSWVAPNGSKQVPVQEGQQQQQQVHVQEGHGRTKTQLPENWAKDKDVDGNKYYYHKNSGETSWVAPNGSKQVPDNSGSGSSNAHNRNKTVMPTGWSADYDANSDKFYIDPNGNMQWEKPPQSNGI